MPKTYADVRNPRPLKPTTTDERPATLWLDIDLTEAQRASLVTFMEEMEVAELLAWIAKKCGLKCTVSVKNEKDWYYAAVMGNEGSEYAYKALTARASTPEKALYSLAFKDLVVLNETWPDRLGRVLDA